MKFPYELSEDRLSLLSKEDLWQYKYEHSIFYHEAQRINEAEYINDYYSALNEDEEFQSLNEEEQAAIVNEYVKAEYEALLETFIDLLSDEELSEDDINMIKEYINNLEDADTSDALNEDSLSPGKDASWWLPDAGLIGRIAKVGIGGGIAAMGALLLAGYDLRAMKKLKVYMNEIVEFIDNGQNKENTFWKRWSKKLGGKLFKHIGENSGNQSRGCFRAIQENVERNRYTVGLTWAKAAGLITGDGIDDALSRNTMDGGYHKYVDGKIIKTLKSFKK